MFDDVTDKVGIITGGNGRIGKIFIRALLDLKNEVYSFDVEKDISFSNSLEVDITSQDEVRHAVHSVVNEHGRIDFLINCAALQIAASYEKAKIVDFVRMIDVNLNGAHICSKLVSDQMIQQKSGNIINIGSIYGVDVSDPSIYGDSGLNSPDAYAASKGGLIHLTKYMAINLGKYNIRVNALSPGGVWNEQQLEFVQKYTPKTALGRMLDREELVGPLLFLLSDASSYVTGHNLMVDGGFTCL